MDDELKDGGQYSWEEQYKRSWDTVQEDEEGTLNTALMQLIQMQKRRRRIGAALAEGVQRGIIRHVVLIIDVGVVMGGRDFKPSYLELTIKLLRQWLLEYFDQNPISQICILITKNGVSQRVSQPSGNPMDHIKVLDDYLDSSMLTGEPSLQNSLELARSILLHAPSHSSREILVIMASLTSRDPGDINETVDSLLRAGIRCSIISLTAEVNICKMICRQTQGEYRVAMNEAHYKDILWEMIPPPPVLVANSKAQMFLMGFPNRDVDSAASLCACHDKPNASGYVCPRCKSKVCNLPIDCKVCGLKLISSPHIARSYHHLFPVPAFKEHSADSTRSTQCYGCTATLQSKNPQTTIKISLSAAKKGSGGDGSPTVRRKSIGLKHSDSLASYQCPKCLQWFCYDCDLFIHENLHNCPGC